jgi:DNA modification methylase
LTTNNHQQINWRSRIVKRGTILASQITPHPNNPRRHPQNQRDVVAASFDELGQIAPVILNVNNGYLVDGEERSWLALAQAEDVEVEAVWVDLTEVEHLKALTYLDASSALAEYDRDSLDTLLREVNSDSVAIQQMLSDLPSDAGLFPDELVEPIVHPTLADRFIVPPFSVLDARQGYWQERKRQWLALGIRGELGRGSATGDGSAGDTRTGRASGDYDGGHAWIGSTKNGRSPARTFGQDLMHGENYKFAQSQNAQLDGKLQRALGAYAAIGGGTQERGQGSVTGTSIFDPVLAELAYRWFCFPGGHVLDPFAGECTKGIVAAVLGCGYTGVELRQEQVDANVIQAREIGVSPNWITGDSSKLEILLPVGVQYDMIFTSPPYYDLEIYSDDEADSSAFEDYELFMAFYRTVFQQAISRLRDNRFLVVKVGEIRDKRGIYRNFVGNNISTFIDLGLNYYNEAILVTAVGSLPVRVGKQFSSGRKLGKTHQNILVFYKGNPKEIKNHFPQDIPYADTVDFPE